MLIFGHAGITLGVAIVAIGTLNTINHLREKSTAATMQVDAPDIKPANSEFSQKGKSSWLTSVTSFIDLRILLVGSLLPDIIDKPVGIYLFPDVFSSGRIFSHTILFALLLTLAAIFLFRTSGKTWMIALSIGTWMHLILDEMWLAPRTLFWPAFGITFDVAYLENWLYTIFYRMCTEPQVYIPELIGLAVSLWFVVLLVYKRKVVTFLKYGTL
jgi:inner membrane protein